MSLSTVSAQRNALLPLGRTLSPGYIEKYAFVLLHRIRRNAVWLNTTSALSVRRQGPCWPVFQKNCPPRGSAIGSGVRVSASFQKNVRLVGQLGSGPRLVSDRADVVPANRVDRLDPVGRGLMCLPDETRSMDRGVATGVISVHKPQKSVTVLFTCGTLTHVLKFKLQ